MNDPREAAEDPASAPTVLRGNSPTIAGMIMGTAEYMSPEQAAGKPVDKRSDIWSFGVVLHEMLTAQRLFAGETTSHTLADVLRAPIHLTSIPGSIRPLLERCLDRDPKRRVRDIGEARILLTGPIEEPQHAPPPAARSVWLPWTTAGVLAAALAGLAFVHYRTSAPPPASAIRFTIPPPEGASFRAGAEISPDGQHIVYRIFQDGQNTLWLHALNSTKPRKLMVEPGFDLGYPFWSPDSRWVAYASGTKLKKIDVTAASPSGLVICDCLPNGRGFRGGTWSRDGVIVFSPIPTGGLLSVPAAGGTPAPLTTLIENKETLHRFPHFLADRPPFPLLHRLRGSLPCRRLFGRSFQVSAQAPARLRFSRRLHSTHRWRFLRPSVVCEGQFSARGGVRQQAPGGHRGTGGHRGRAPAV
ncbi:MAG: protein kinase [Acidobacteria bacterium]|nr:protein kinase [Acidobacteriota bacterium]